VRRQAFDGRGTSFSRGVGHALECCDRSFVIRLCKREPAIEGNPERRERVRRLFGCDKGRCERSAAFGRIVLRKRTGVSMFDRVLGGAGDAASLPAGKFRSRFLSLSDSSERLG
jgi:hypothetical protein